MPDPRINPISANQTYVQPKEIKLESIPGGVKLSRCWTFKTEDIFIGVIGFLLLVFELGNLFFDSVNSVNFVEIILIIVGPLMFYFALAHRFNTTRFSASREKISVGRGPLPWFGRRTLPSADVVKLTFRADRHRTRSATWFTYPLVATLRNGKDAILDVCDKEDQAGFLSQELSRNLGL
jgi:hypothetical protein